VVRSCDKFTIGIESVVVSTWTEDRGGAISSSDFLSEFKPQKNSTAAAPSIPKAPIQYA